jgi:alkylation response protein AidB-like acyl-CoA dehydrogenase
MFGVSLILIEKTMPGIVTRKMKCMSGGVSGTTFISFENVKVPVENLIGEENEGFKAIMFNFNHERLMICMGALGSARLCYEDAMRFAHKRRTFGKTLIEHPVIRAKLANMIR